MSREDNIEKLASRFIEWQSPNDCYICNYETILKCSGCNVPVCSSCCVFNDELKPICPDCKQKLSDPEPDKPEEEK